MKKKELKRLLKISTEYIDKQNAKIDKLHSKLLSQKISPHIKDAVAEMNELEKDIEEIPTSFYEDSSKSFSSRFMPNVKFSVMGKKRDLLDKLKISSCNYNYLRTNSEGVIWNGCDYKGKFDDEWTNQKEVSIYEAIPELVPDGMVYDKERDSLVKKDVVEMPTNFSESSYTVSICDACEKKVDCTFLEILGASPAITECVEFEKSKNVKLSDALMVVQRF